MWQHSAPSNQTVQIPPHNYSLDVDSPSDPPMSQEETLESQEEYPQEAAEEAVEEEEEAEEAEEEEEEAEEEAFPLRYLQHKLTIQETNLSATRCLHLPETVLNRRHS